ncbi:phospholipid-transporting ATPase ABCA3-like [Amblyomma americanum]
MAVCNARLRISDGTIKAACAPVARSPFPEEQFATLLAKRFSCLYRSKFVLVAGWLVPILVFSFGICIASAKLFTARDMRHRKSIDLRVSAQFPGSTVFLQAGPSQFAGRFVSLLRQQGARVTVMKDAHHELRAMAQDKYDHYSTQIAFGGVFSSSEIELWYSPYSPISRAVGLNLITTTLNQVYSGDTGARILTTLRTYNKSRPRETWPTEFVPELTRNRLFWCLVPTVAFGFLAAAFALQPASERLSGARTLFLMTGVSRQLMVFADLAFDVFFYACPMTICLALYILFFEPGYTTTGALVLTIASFAPVAVLSSYAIAEFASRAQSAYVTCLTIFVIGAPTLHVAYVLRTTMLQKSFPRVALSAFPPVALTSAVLRAVNLQVEGEACIKLRSTRVGARTALHSACPNVSALGPGFQHCCEMLSENRLDKWDVLGPFNLSRKSILTDLTIMMAEGLILFAILCACPPKIREAFPRKTGVSESREMDESVTAEKAAVETACAEANFTEYALVLNSVSRFYGNLAAVKAVSLAVRPGECLGVLGSSGSGKTTLLSMIAGITLPNCGECYSTAGSMSHDLRKWQPYIGTCPQSGGLLEAMTARSFLTVIGRLRDIPEQQIGDAVDVMLQLCDLQKPADQPCHTYTYADKRKLSIAAALITMPPIVLLDEPFNGVDITTKEIITHVLRRVRSFAGVAVLLATHSMDDCELTCNRVAVLSKGEIICIGNLSELKRKFSKGYTFQFVLHRVSASDALCFKNNVESIFPDIKLCGNVSKNTLEYNADHKIIWSHWFEKMTVLEKNYVLEHIYMSDTISTQMIVVLVKTKEASFIIEDLNAGPAML